jgi:hypothetical protein
MLSHAVTLRQLPAPSAVASKCFVHVKQEDLCAVLVYIISLPCLPKYDARIFKKYETAALAMPATLRTEDGAETRHSSAS